MLQEIVLISLQDASVVAEVRGPRYHGHDELIAHFARIGADDVKMLSVGIVGGARGDKQSSGFSDQFSGPVQP